MSHRKAAKAGYQVIPIIPPAAKLIEGSVIPAEATGKTPGRRYGSKGWGGFDWINFDPTDSDYTEWEQDGAGVGIKTGTVIAVDIDVLDPWLSDIIEQHCLDSLMLSPDETPRRIGNPPKRLLVLRLVDDDGQPAVMASRKLRFADFLGEPHLLEILGSGKQFVAKGLHPTTGMEYRWTQKLCRLSALPAVTESQLDQWLTEIEAHLVEDHGCGEIQTSSSSDRMGCDQELLSVPASMMDQLEEAVASIPNTSEVFPTRDDYVRFGCAVKAGFAEDEDRGKQVWLDWCERWKDGHNDVSEAVGDWERMKPPFSVGQHWLFELAREHGGYSRVRDVFGGAAAAGVSSPGHDSAGNKLTGVEFFDRYVWVRQLQLFADTWGHHGLLSKDAFSREFAGRVGEGTSGKNSPAELWFTSPKRRIVDAITYRPRQPAVMQEHRSGVALVCVNTWRPGPGDALGADGGVDVQPWLDLVEALVPDKRERETLLDWLAWQVQRPGHKCNWHPLIWGAQGIGKDTLLQPLRWALGGNNCLDVPAQVFLGSFNSWVEGRSVCIVQEVNTFERRELSDRVKNLLADPPSELLINRKFVAEYDVPNVCNFVMLSNHSDGFAIEAGDRRLFVLHCEASRVEMEPLTAACWHWLAGGSSGVDGMRAVCQWLMARDLAAFQPKASAPETDAKQAMREQTQGIAESLVQQAIDSEMGPFSCGKDLATGQEVRAYIKAVNPSAAAKISAHRIGKIMATVGMQKPIADQVRLPAWLGGKTRLWAGRRHHVYRSMGEYRRDEKTGEEISSPKALRAEYMRQVRLLAEDDRRGLFPDWRDADFDDDDDDDDDDG